MRPITPAPITIIFAIIVSSTPTRIVAFHHIAKSGRKWRAGPQ
jgi:hypothetical protein